jgi:hypothetical protein
MKKFILFLTALLIIQVANSQTDTNQEKKKEVKADTAQRGESETTEQTRKTQRTKGGDVTDDIEIETCIITNSIRPTSHTEEETINCFPKVSFDFRERNSITIPKKLRTGDFYQVVVSNINLNDYQVVVKGTDTIYSSPLSFPTFGSIDLSGLENIISSISTSGAVSAIIQESAEKKSGYIDDSTDVGSLDKGAIEAIRAIVDSIAKANLTVEEQVQSKVAEIKNLSKIYLAELKYVQDKIDSITYAYMEHTVLAHGKQMTSDFTGDVKKDLKKFK